MRARIRFGWFALSVAALWLGRAAAVNQARTLPQTDENMKTGPAVGTAIPQFEAVDQNGKRQTFETLRGPKGLVLLVVRSADW